MHSAINFSRRTSITSWDTEISWNMFWKTLSPHSTGGQPPCLWGCSTVILSLRLQSRTLGPFIAVSKSDIFFHFLGKQWPCARFEFTTRWSSTFFKSECFCCHSNKLLMKISTSNCQITRVFQVNSARALWESVPFSTPIPLKCLCLYLLFPS